MLLLVDLSLRRRGLYEGLLDAMVLYAALVDLVKVLFRVIFLGRRCWAIYVSLSRKVTLQTTQITGNVGSGSKYTDLLSHNNVGFSIFKWIKGVEVP
jgi:hypothetical protein